MLTLFSCVFRLTLDINDMAIRDRSHYQIWWIFGKLPNGFRPPSPHFRKIILQFFSKNVRKKPLKKVQNLLYKFLDWFRWCIRTVSRVRGAFLGPQKDPKRAPNDPKWQFWNHKWVRWLWTGSRVWNKVGTSQGTSGVMHWNCFSGQGDLWRAQKGPQRTPNAPK